MADERERPWQYELLDKMPSSIDMTQLEENLRLTPTERLEKMLKVLRFLRGARAGAGLPDDR